MRWKIAKCLRAAGYRIAPKARRAHYVWGVERFTADTPQAREFSERLRNLHVY